MKRIFDFSLTFIKILEREGVSHWTCLALPAYERRIIKKSTLRRERFDHHNFRPKPGEILTNQAGPLFFLRQKKYGKPHEISVS